MATGRPMHSASLSPYAVTMLSTTGVFGRIRSFLLDDRGQGLVEYALVIATVSLVAIAALNMLGRKANNTLHSVAASLS
jgi:Flp pilus assembly pilin Flp